MEQHDIDVAIYLKAVNNHIVTYERIFFLSILDNVTVWTEALRRSRPAPMFWEVPGEN